MKVTIYGKATGCKFCDTAKEICENKKFNMNFIDIQAEGIDGSQLSEICGVAVHTVPQIFVNDEYVPGGCTGFVEGLREGLWN